MYALPAGRSFIPVVGVSAYLIQVYSDCPFGPAGPWMPWEPAGPCTPCGPWIRLHSYGGVGLLVSVAVVWL